MMKKVWLVLLAVVLVFGLAVSCGSSGGGDDGDEGWTHDLTAGGPLVIELKGNFRYGDGYQANFEPAALFKGGKVTEGDVYTLEISFTADRDLTDDETVIHLGLVDRTTDYWNPLTWVKDAENATEDQKAENFAGMEIIDTKELQTGVTDLTLTFTALKTSPGTNADMNSLTLQFKSPTDLLGRPSTDEDKETYNPNPVKLTFTKFIFIFKGDGGSGIEEPGEEEDEGNLGLPNYNKGDDDSDGAESQAIWTIVSTHAKYSLLGEDGTKLVVTFENQITGGMQLIWQRATDWNSTEIVAGTGTGNTGVTISEDKKTISIALSADTLKNYADNFLAAVGDEANIKIILAYYSGTNKMKGLKVVKASLE